MLQTISLVMRFLFLLVSVASMLILQSNMIFAISKAELEAVINNRPFYVADSDCSTDAGSGIGGESSSTVKNVFMLGDSITVIAADAYKAAFQAVGASVTIDASYGRGLISPGGGGSVGPSTNPETNGMTGMTILSQHKDDVAMKAADTIIMALGTNDNNLTGDQVKMAMAIIKDINPSAKVYWVDTATVSDNQLYTQRPSWVQSANTAIHGQALESGYTVIPWFTTVFPGKDPTKVVGARLVDSQNFIREDQGKKDVHPTSAGIKALTDLVVSSVGGGSGSDSGAGSGGDSSACCSTSDLSGSALDNAVMAIAHSSITETWGISDSMIEEFYLKNGDPIQISRVGVTPDNIHEVTAAIRAEGVSPVLLYLYAINEGHNSDGSASFINHTARSGDAVAIARADAKYLADQSKIMNSQPSWYDAGNPVHFVPQDIQDAGNTDFKSMPSGTIGRAYIPATAASTWEVYYPDGLKKEFNKVQDYAAPLHIMAQNIEKLGGNPMQGGSGSVNCSSGVAGEGMTRAISWAKMIAANDGYGYDQNTRTTGWTNWQKDPSCTDQCGSFDCSSFVAAALTEAGYFTENPNFNTTSEPGYLEQAGFTQIASSATSSSNLQPGDILISQNHTAIYIGNDQVVHASLNENGDTTGGQVGDQNGKEVYISAFNGSKGWNSVWRAPN